MQTREAPRADVAQRPVPPFRAQWLGRAGIVSTVDRERSPLIVGKHAALIAYLDAQPDQASTRQHLVTMFWADRKTETKARGALRSALKHVRSKLGDDLLKMDGDEVRIGVALQSDRSQLLRAIDRKAWVEAIAYYTGEFMSQFAAPGADLFEAWAANERVRLASLYLGAAESHARELIGCGRFTDAVAVAHLVNQQICDDQRASRFLLETLLAANDFVRGLAEIARIETKLRDDGDKAEDETIALIDRMKARSQRAPQPNSPESSSEKSLRIARELIGREREFAAITSAWERVQSGREGAWIHCEAPAGFGKTRLLADVASRIRTRKALVINVRAHAGERQMKFSTAASLAMALVSKRGARAVSEESANVIVGLVPAASTYLQARGADTSTGDESIRRRASVLTELLQRVAEENAIALFVDDLHWADSASQLILASVLSHAAESRILVVSASRTGFDNRHVASPNQTLKLSGFGVDETEQLMSDAAALSDDQYVQAVPARLAECTSGSPLLVIESIHRAFESGVLAIFDGTWQVRNRELLDEMLADGSAISYRISQLTDDEQFALGCLAFAELPIAASILQWCLSERHNANVQARLQNESTLMTQSELSLPDVSSIVSALEIRGMVLQRNSLLEVAHDEIAEVWRRWAGDDLKHRVRSVLSFALIRVAVADRSALARAVRLMFDSAYVVPKWLLRRLINEARGVNDKRKAIDILQSCVGDIMTLEQQQNAVRALSLKERSPVAFRASVALAAAACLVLVGTATQAFRSTGETPRSVTLLIAANHAGQYGMHKYVLDRADIERRVRVGNRTLPAVPLARRDPRLNDKNLIFLKRGGQLPNGDRLVQNDEQGADTDSMLPSIGVLSAQGSIQYVALHKADDVQPSWARNGEWILFGTRRWTKETGNHIQVALQRRADSSITQLTFDQGDKFFASESPDGTRMLFTQSATRQGPAQLCWKALPGMVAQSGCLSASRGEILDGAGATWRDANHVIAQLVVRDAQGEQSTSLVMFDMLGRMSVIADGASRYSVSPDGEWALSTRQRDDGSQYVEAFRVDDPMQSRVTLDGLGDGNFVEPVWDVPYRAPVAVAFAQLQGERIAAQVGEIRTIDAKATWSALPINLTGVAVVSVSDSAVAFVDSLLTIHPHAPGSALVKVSLGALQYAVNVVVSPPTAQESMPRSGWPDSLNTDWYQHGTPVPTLTSLSSSKRSQGRSLVFGGDNNRLSGITSRWTLNAAVAGAGAEATFTLRANDRIKTSATIALVAGLASDSAALWKPDVDAPPAWWAAATRNACAAYLSPSQLTPDRMTVIASVGEREFRSQPISPGVDGRFTATVRLQVFADGACHVAVNGVSLRGRVGKLGSLNSIRVQIFGDAPNHDVNVTRVRAWRGVDRETAWSYERVAVRSPSRPMSRTSDRR